MTDQPKPTPVARPQCTEMHIDLLITTCERLTANNQQLQQRVEELTSQLAHSDCYLAASERLREEADADLRTAADQCEALAKDLSDHKQLLAIKNRQLDTMVEENRRLRELLRQYKHRLDKRWREGTRMDAYARGYQDGLEAAEVIFDDVFNAIGRTGE